MPRTFDVPSFYRSPSVLAVKQARSQSDPKKRDLTPSLLDFGSVRFKLARHFGFCFGVENAIEIAYRVLNEHPDKTVYLLSEMIHNPQVNTDLQSRGVRFLMGTDGTCIIPFSELRSSDIVIVPAFGTTLEIQEELAALGIDPYKYDATCPFVEKVWKRAADLGQNGFTVIVHGKRQHEETRATFSHSNKNAPTLVVLNMEEALLVASFMKGEVTPDQFNARFAQNISCGFDSNIHLQKIGVVNQTTMLASETHAIAQLFRNTMIELYGEKNLSKHFADTKDTLCYATYENQSATRQLTASGADLSLVVGGYNSSNTSHLVELCEMRMPTYFINDANEILSRDTIRHFDIVEHRQRTSDNWLPAAGLHPAVEIGVTAGASCPDLVVDAVIRRVLSFFPDARPFEEALTPYVSSCP